MYYDDEEINIMQQVDSTVNILIKLFFLEKL